MTIDTNCHLGHWPFRRVAHADADGLLRLLDGNCMDGAWVGAFEGLFYRDCGEANRGLRAAIAGHEDRLRPWATINPAFPAWEDDLREALDTGMAGVRLFPNYHGYALGDPCVRELLDRVGRDRPAVPVALYHKFVDERLHHWTCLVPPVEMTLAPLVAAYPDQAFLLCGCSSLMADALREPIGAGRVYVETSRIEGVEGIRQLCDTIGAERVVLGSHAPYFYMQAAHLKLVESGLSDAERELLLVTNPARMMRA